MNVRCYRCGNSFSLSREAVESAVVAAGTDKYYVAYCPRCRQANKIPMQQLKRSLPAGWTPPAPEATAAEAPVAVAAPAAEPEPIAAPATEPVGRPGRKRGSKSTAATPAPELTPVPEPVAEAAPAAKASRKRASKTADVPPAPEASPAAKKASRSKSKPS